MSNDSVKVVELDGVKIYTEFFNVDGNQPVVVFLHDSLGCVELWRDFPRRLSEMNHCNVMVYDRQGYGKSDPMLTYERPVNYLEIEADRLMVLLEYFGLKKVILFGHSDGGSIALIAASKYPDQINAVVAEAAHIFVEDVTLDGIYKAKEAYRSTNLHQRLVKYHGDKVETLFRAWTETWIRNDYRDWNIEHFVSSILCPVLFVQGETDEYGSIQQVDKTVHQVQGKADKYILPNVGHTPHKEAPDLVLERVTSFIGNL